MLARTPILLAALDPATDVRGSNGVDVRVADGVAWVTEQVSSRHDHCAGPVTGRVLARIALPDPDQNYVPAIDGRHVYYLAQAGNGCC